MSRPTRDSAAGRAYLDLQNRARRERRPTQELLTLYVVERWLARLSRSSRMDDFVLKGGMLLAAYGRRRPTADADALARNMNGDERTVAEKVAEIASLPDPDGGVDYASDTLTTTVIRDDALYAGVRVSMDARIATAAVKLRLDVNFGDPVTPAPQLIDLPALRPGADAIRILGYPVETVIAEKLTTAVVLGAANTRVRDYADIYALITSRDLDDRMVQEAVRATADYRGTPLLPLSDTSAELVTLRARAYAAYRSSLGLSGHDLPEDFADLVRVVAAFGDRVLTDRRAK
jgi:hypothetical protein